jgi:V/A-type H+-transporting ATPase subunit K
MEPIVLAYIGAALMITIPGICSGIGFAMCGNATIGAVKKNPTGFGNCLILSAVPSSNGLYGFIGFYLTINATFFAPEMSWFIASAIFAGGLILGLVAGFCCIKQADICANGIAAIGSGQNALGNTLILAAFPEFFAILSLLGVILINGAIG